LLRAKFYLLEGFSFFQQTNNEEAFYRYNQSINILEKLSGDQDADVELVENFINITLLQKTNFDNVSTRLMFTRALNLFEKHNYFYGIWKCYNALVNIYMESKEYDDSLTYYNRALEAHNKAGSEQGESLVYNNLGTLYIH
jgi:pentatricopeptide repeat protein